MAIGTLAVLAALAGAVLYHVNVTAGWVIEPSFWLLHTCAALSYGAVGGWLAVLRRVPVIPWIFLGIGLAHGMRMLIHEYAVLGAHIGWPLAGPALWIGSWLWAPAHLAIGALLPLLLPDGRLPSPRWRPV